MTTGPTGVLTADDQRAVGDGVSMRVGLIDGVQAVGTACDGAEAAQLAAVRRPTCTMDLRMPGTTDRRDGGPARADLLPGYRCDHLRRR